MNVYEYVDELNKAYHIGDGEVLAELLCVDHPHAKSEGILEGSAISSIRKRVTPPWDEVFIAHIKCIKEIRNGSYAEAFKHQSTLVQCFQKILQSQKDENWALPVMYTMCLDVRRIATKGDLQLDAREKPHELLEKGADLIMGFFRICVGDNRALQEDTKRWGLLNLTNHLFKIYFKVNKLHLLKPLIRVIESSSLKDLYPISQRVTYKYFVGQQQMFQNRFKEAEENLSFAFKHCHKDSKKNKRLILIFLVTVKMVLGILPTKQLLEKYNLMQFAEIAQAVKDGDFRRFGESVETYQSFFVKWGISMVLEKLRSIIMRNLFKKVYLMCGTHIISLQILQDALNFRRGCDYDVPIDEDETLCMISGLIYDNKMKGYISYSHMKIVLSKQNPFPQLPAVE